MRGDTANIMDLSSATGETSVFRRTYCCHAADKQVDPSSLIAGLNK